MSILLTLDEFVKLAYAHLEGGTGSDGVKLWIPLMPSLRGAYALECQFEICLKFLDSAYAHFTGGARAQMQRLYEYREVIVGP